MHGLKPAIAKRVTPPKPLGLGLNLSTKKTRKREFLDEMDRVVPWSALVQIVEPHSPRAKTGRPPFAIETMLRIHYFQQWFGLSMPAFTAEQWRFIVSSHGIPVPRRAAVPLAPSARSSTLGQSSPGFVTSTGLS